MAAEDMVPVVQEAKPPHRGLLRFGWAPAVLLIAVGLIMLWNSFSHEPEHIYDAGTTRRLLVGNSDLANWRPHYSTGTLRHQAVLYFVMLGKLARLVQVLSFGNWHPFYFVRLVHIAWILGMAYLYGFRLVPGLLGQDRGLVRWFLFALFLLPNLYLGQVMVRADHLLFLSVNLLFYLWFRHDFAGQLPRSGWRLACWSLLLVMMGHSREFGVAAFAVFLSWGVAVIVPEVLRTSRFGYRLGMPLLVAVTVLAAGSHYIMQYLKTGHLISQPPASQYLLKFAKRSQGFDRRIFFLNFEFDEVLRVPNRNATFHATRVWPARAFNPAVRRPGFRDDNNSFLPRLYSDMWGDHWLYFSGRKPFREDNLAGHKTPLKRVVLLLAAPFTLIYFGVPLFGAATAARKLLRRRALDAADVAAVLFALILAVDLLWLYMEPEPGKNNTVKFVYLFAYAWFPFIALAAFLRRHPRFRRVFLPYTYLLFAACAPLFMFVP